MDLKMTSSSPVRVAFVGPEDAPEAVVEVTMANAERRNSLSDEMLAALHGALDDAEAANARAMILRAEAGVTTWSAGYDITALPLDGTDPLTWTNPLEYLLHEVRRAPFPIVAAVEGGVWGGACELALACDLIVACRTSTFAITPTRLGVPYNTAGVATFVAALPLNVAREMFFCADPLPAVDLAGYGVVNRLVDDPADLGDVAAALARRIALRAPLAVRAIKGEMTALTDARPLTSEEFERLTEQRRRAWTSEDYAEGVRAFREKRTPRFTGT